MIGRPLTANQAIVFRAIDQAAQAGRYCPKNDELADALGAQSAQTAGAILKNLELYGLIVIEKTGRHRRVRVLPTGQVTR
jgi:hypothetical protein